VIRSFGEKDAHAVAELLHADELPEAVTAAGLLHWLRTQPPRAHAASWVAEGHGELVGWARARLLWKTSAEGVGEPWVFVRPSARRDGYGGRLFQEASGHLAGAGARLLQTWTLVDVGRRFLEERGFRPTRSERVSILDLVSADLPAAASRPGVRVVALRDVLDRPRELHALDAATSADVPETFGHDNVRYEEWLEETLSHPQLTVDGSFIVLDGDLPVAFALVEVDPEHGVAANEMTGTLPEYRRRGLARLAKAAAIRWAAESGFRALRTTNDERNVAMLRLNESLGYRPVGIETQYLRET
jgi:GNAT superfamily N-acetyltransferase